MDIRSNYSLTFLGLNMRDWLQHKLHPMHIWCRWGKYKRDNLRYCICFKVYEKMIWQPFLRRLLRKEIK
jgi:hypothetical protein